MRKAFKLFTMYFIFAVVFIVLGTAFYSLYLNIVGFSAGQQMLLFSKNDLFKSLIYVSCCFVMFVCPFLAYYRIRHRGGLFQILFYILLSFATWFLIFPSILKVGNDNNLFEANRAFEHNVTAHYFRQVDDKVYYLTQDLKSSEKDSSVTGVIIDVDGEKCVNVSQINNDKDFVLFTHAEPYNDILIKDTFGGNKSFSFYDFKGIFKRGALANEKGGSFWLGFLSLGLVLCCVYGLSNLFNWKLINASVVILVTVGIFALNTFYYYPVFDFLRNGRIGQSGLFVSLSAYVDDPILVFINLIFSFVFIVIGIIKFLNKNKESE